ncbi:MAG: FkbM family methyltransferase [Aquabacterium sp.]|nr:FkbM family methyltransferase [Aquabacterium sp.]
METTLPNNAPAAKPSESLNRSSFYARGMHLARATPKSRLAALIRQLWPVRTDVDLLRIGGFGDGGYLVPDDLQGIDACFSPGVDILASFESALLADHGIGSHLADRSVDGPPAGFMPLSFLKKFVGAADDESHVTLQTWIDACAPSATQSDLLLQMDIEGAEYMTVLAAPPDLLRRCRIIVIEIHDVHAWSEPTFFKIVEAFFGKLLADFHVVHNHPNNCCASVHFGDLVAPAVFELTLHRKDRCRALDFVARFPHPLDSPNVPAKVDVSLPPAWFFQRRKLRPPHAKVFLNEVSGVVHIGANTGQERELYALLGLEVLWFEAIPEVHAQLQRNIAALPKQRAIQALLLDRDGVACDFQVASNGGMSSSVLPLARHREIWPEIDYVRTVSLRSTTLASALRAGAVAIDAYQAMILDTQGSELLILQGAGDLLRGFRYIEVEAADFEAYSGAPSIGALQAFLSAQGFVEIQRVQIANKPGVGSYFDILFAARSALPTSSG